MLKHGILGLLSYYDRTGYEIMEVFKDSLNFMWNANTSQVYRELNNLKEAGWATVTEVEQQGKPDKKIYSITDGGREELMKWLTDCENFKLPNQPMLMKLFFGGMLSKEDALKALDSIKDSHLERSCELENIIPKIDTYKKDTNNDYYAMFWDMTLDFGKMYCESVVKWCDECITKIKARNEG